MPIDSISRLLTSIRNKRILTSSYLSLPYTQINYIIIKLLEREGLVQTGTFSINNRKFFLKQKKGIPKYSLSYEDFSFFKKFFNFHKKDRTIWPISYSTLDFMRPLPPTEADHLKKKKSSLSPKKLTFTERSKKKDQFNKTTSPAPGVDTAKETNSALRVSTQESDLTLVTPTFRKRKNSLLFLKANAKHLTSTEKRTSSSEEAKKPSTPSQKIPASKLKKTNKGETPAKVNLKSISKETVKKKKKRFLLQVRPSLANQFLRSVETPSHPPSKIDLLKSKINNSQQILDRNSITKPKVTSQSKTNIAEASLKKKENISNTKPQILKPTREKKKLLLVLLKHLSKWKKKPLIHSIKRISKPSLRWYSSHPIPSSLGGLGIFIVSTSSGIMTDKEARIKKIGGEIMAEIW